MKISIYGTGNVANVLSRKIATSGNIELVSISGRNETAGRKLAELSNSIFVSKEDIAEQRPDLLILAVSDSAINMLELPSTLSSTLIAHTAGAVSKDVLKQFTSKYAVLYPLQSLRKELPDLPEIPFLIDAAGDDLAILATICNSLGSEYKYANDSERLSLHTAAVVVSNFTNHLYALAEEFCKDKEVPFSVLQPLIQETASRLIYASPHQLQTGPAIRNDFETIQRHLGVLEHHPKLRLLYGQLSASITGN